MSKDETKSGKLSPFPSQLSQGGHPGELLIPSIRDVLGVFFRHKWKVALTFLVIAVGGGVFVMLMPNVYQSQATLLISNERGALSLDPSQQGLVAASSRNSRNNAYNEMAIITSEELAEGVVKVLGVERLLNLPPGETVESVFEKAEDPQLIARNVSRQVVMSMIETRGEGDVIQVAATSYNPQLAHAVLEALLELYRERHIEVHSSAASPQMFEAKSKDIKAQLDQKETALREYREKYNTSGSIEQKDAYFARVGELESALMDARVASKAGEAKITALEASLAKWREENGGDPIELENPRVTVLKDRLLTLQLEEIDLASQYVDHRDLRRVRQQIVAVEEAIAALPTSMPGGVGGLSGAGGADPGTILEAERIELIALKAAEESLVGELAQARTRLEGLEEHESAAMMLQREVNHLRDAYWEYQNSLERAEISAALDRDKISNVSVIQAATMPLIPIGPRRTRNLAMVFFLGAMAGIGLAFVFEYFDDTLKTKDEIERKLGVTVLATISADEYEQCI